MISRGRAMYQLLLIGLLCVCSFQALGERGRFPVLLKAAQQAIDDGRLNQAIQLLQQVEATTYSNAQKNLLDIALADAWMRQGRIEQAERQLSAVFPIVQSGGNLSLISAVLQRRGHLAKAGNDLLAAREWYQQALHMAEQSTDNAEIVSALINLSSLDQRGELLERAFLLTETLPDQTIRNNLLNALAYQAAEQAHIELAYRATQSVLAQTDDARLRSQALGLLGSLYAEQQRTDEALLLTEQALIADGDMDLQMQWQWQRAGLLSRKGESQLALESYRTAIQYLQQIRIDIPVFYQDGRSSFNQTYAPLYMDYINALLAHSKQVNVKKRQQLLAELIERWEQLKVVELQDYFRDACAVRQQQQARQLDETVVMLYPIILQDKLVLVSRFSDVIEVNIAPVSATELAEQLQGFNSKMIEQQAFAEISERFYQWLIAPIADRLVKRRIKTIVYLPDGVLRKLPFAMLSDGEQFLIEQVALVSVPGLSMVAEASEQLNKNDILLAGLSEPGPVVDELLKKRINVLQTINSRSRGLALRGGNIPDGRYYAEKKRQYRLTRLKRALELPGVSEELSSLQAVSQGSVVKDERFTLENFRNSVHRGHQFVHIASHGFFSGDPEKSFVMTYDRLLTMKQLAALFQTEAFHNRPVEMVALSACQTAEGDDRSPLGLSSVVVQTGVKSAVGSLWPVSDDAAQQFFSDFYRFYQQPGASKASALQAAQKKLMKLYPHPFYWAPFILVGEWH